MIPIQMKSTEKCAKPNNYISEHIKTCIDVYKKGYTKLDEKSATMEGMIQFKARNLLNLLAEMDNCKYLQIGTWKGACLYSALYKNKFDYVFACDDFSQYVEGQGGTFKDENGNYKTKMHLDFDVLLRLMQPEEEEQLEFDFYDGNCFSMPLKEIKESINMYFYDGGHTLADHFLALYYYYPVFEKDFIFICDDWSEKAVRAGTYAAIEQCQYKIISSHTEQNMYIAHLQKNMYWGDYLAQDRIARKKSKHCILNSKDITKEDINT